jgi:hypothetical protein
MNALATAIAIVAGIVLLPTLVLQVIFGTLALALIATVCAKLFSPKMHRINAARIGSRDA